MVYLSDLIYIYIYIYQKRAHREVAEFWPQCLIFPHSSWSNLGVVIPRLLIYIYIYIYIHISEESTQRGGRVLASMFEIPTL